MAASLTSRIEGTRLPALNREGDGEDGCYRVVDRDGLRGPFSFLCKRKHNARTSSSLHVGHARSLRLQRHKWIDPRCPARGDVTRHQRHYNQRKSRYRQNQRIACGQ